MLIFSVSFQMTKCPPRRGAKKKEKKSWKSWRGAKNYILPETWSVHGGKFQSPHCVTVLTFAASSVGLNPKLVLVANHSTVAKAGSAQLPASCITILIKTPASHRNVVNVLPVLATSAEQISRPNRVYLVLQTRRPHITNPHDTQLTMTRIRLHVLILLAYLTVLIAASTSLLHPSSVPPTIHTYIQPQSAN